MFEYVGDSKGFTQNGSATIYGIANAFKKMIKHTT